MDAKQARRLTRDALDGKTERRLEESARDSSAARNYAQRWVERNINWIETGIREAAAEGEYQYIFDIPCWDTAFESAVIAELGNTLSGFEIIDFPARICIDWQKQTKTTCASKNYQDTPWISGSM